MIEVTSSSEWQEDITTKRSEYARTGFQNYAILRHGVAESETEGYIMGGH